jgi:chromate reductase
MIDPVRVAAFAGSLRAGSYNKMLLAAAVKAAPPDVRIEPFDVADVPLYNADLDDPVTPLPPVQRIRDCIRGADALLIVSPEYNYSIPAVTKNVLDWASRDDTVLDGKAAAVMGASRGGFGTVRMQLHLRQVGVFTNTFFINDPQVHVARAAEKFNAQGELIDERIKEEITELLSALATFARRLKRGAAVP